MIPFLKKMTWFIPTILFVLIIRIFVMAIYLVPTPSMEPTLKSGDLIVAIKPCVLERMTPQKNEVWLFSKPGESNDSNLTMVKRIYGTPGDTIQFYKGVIKVNGIPNNMARLRTNTISAGSFPYSRPMIFPNDTSKIQWSALDFGPLWIPQKGTTIVLNTLNTLLYSRYVLYESPDLSLKQNGIIMNGDSELTEYTFTKNYFFACGDNLTFSVDSRHWGLVPESNLISKAKLIIFPLHKPFLNIKRFFQSID